MPNEIRADMLKVKRMISEVEMIIGKREGETKLVNKLIDAENLLTYCMSRLENAVVPPCKVGDTIYYNLKKNASLPFGTKRTLSLPVVAIAKTEDKGLWFVRTEFSGSIADFKFSDFGKTVFLNIEAAERALKEGADNG